MDELKIEREVAALSRKLVAACNEDGVSEVVMTASLGQVIAAYTLSQCQGDVVEAQKFCDVLLANVGSYITEVVMKSRHRKLKKEH